MEIPPRTKEIESTMVERYEAFEEMKKIFGSEMRKFLAESEDKLRVCDADRHDKECALHQQIKKCFQKSIRLERYKVVMVNYLNKGLC